MLPIGDTKIPDARKPIFTIIFLLVNVGVFIYQLTLSQPHLQQFIFQFGVVPVEILQGDNLHSLVTHQFMHGGWLHIISNMLFLWVFGDNIEAVKGHLGFIMFYLLGGFAAAAAHILFNPESVIPSIGASGAVSAMLGAYLIWFPTSRIKVLIPIFFYPLIIRVSAFVFLLFWIVLQFVYGLASIGATAETAGVAYWAHIGGFAFGLAMGIVTRLFDPSLNNIKV